MKEKIICVLLIALSWLPSSAQLIPTAYSDEEGNYYLCWDTTQVSYIAAMIGDSRAKDSIISNLEKNIADLRLELEVKEQRIANLEHDQQLGNQQKGILEDTLVKAQRLIKWLKLKSTVLAGTAAAILLYSLTIGAGK